MLFSKWLKNVRPWLAYSFLLLVTGALVIFLQYSPIVLQAAKEEDAVKYEFIHGLVEKTASPNAEGEVQFSVRGQEGLERGRLLEANVSSLNNFNKYKTGDAVLVVRTTDKQSSSVKYEIADYYHQDGLLWSFIVFAAITFLIARTKGLTAIVSVVFSLVLFFLVFIRMIQVGYSPLLACLIFIFVVTLLTIPLIHGFNRKSLSAIIAIFIGYFASIAIVYLFKNLAGLGDSPAEEFRLLGVMYNQIELAEILIASIFLGAVGALIDTAISISSAVFEALKEHRGLTFAKVRNIGMEVGKDVLGSMTNTLLFAYLASALPFLVLISLSKVTSFREMINTDFIALELTRTFIGAVSLVVLIPVTAIISAYFLTRKKAT